MNNNPETSIISGGAEHNPVVHHLFVDNILARAEALPKGGPFTYGATPLDRTATFSQQLELATVLRKFTLSDLPEEVPLETIDYIHRTFLERFHGRAEANEENYTTALVPKETYADKPGILSLFEKAELGTASPTEILITRNLRGIRSAELACLTHPYGARIEMLDEMRSVVQDHVEGFGGTYYDTPETRYRVKEVVWSEDESEDRMLGLLMTRKRTLGQILDGTIIRERSSFLLRADEGGFLTDKDLEQLESVDLSSKTWQDDLVQVARLDEIAAFLLDNDEHTLAIPISSTIYGYNLDATRQIEERDATEKQHSREKFATEFPNLAKARWDQTEVEVEVDGGIQRIHYVGPKLNK